MGRRRRRRSRSRSHLFDSFFVSSVELALTNGETATAKVSSGAKRGTDPVVSDLSPSARAQYPVALASKVVGDMSQLL